MKKTYIKPQLTTVVITGSVASLLAGSNLPTEQENDLYWESPDGAFDSDEEIA